MGYMIPPDITALEKIRKLALARTPNLVRQRAGGEGNIWGIVPGITSAHPPLPLHLPHCPPLFNWGSGKYIRIQNTIYKEQLTNYPGALTNVKTRDGIDKFLTDF